MGPDPNSRAQALVNRIDTVRSDAGMPPAARIGPNPPRASRETIRSLQLELNALNGRLTEQRAARAFEEYITGRQVTFETSTGSRTRVDFMIGRSTVLEVKGSSTARQTRGQRQLMEDITQGRVVTPVGSNASAAGFRSGVPTKLDGYMMSIPGLLP